MPNTSGTVRIGISLGDPAGIGPELAVRLLRPELFDASVSLSLYAPPRLVESAASDFQVDYSDASLVPIPEPVSSFAIGIPSSVAGGIALSSLTAATDALLSGEVDALVTLPIDKSTIAGPQFPFAGHTEYLAARAGIGRALMLMVHDDLRVALVTVHIPLAQVAASVTGTLLMKRALQLQQSLMDDFGIRQPRLAVLGLNPHAGDGGLLGAEEQSVIQPVLTEFRSRGGDISGPFPADGFFAMGAYRQYDGILAMYHDQGLTPFKVLSGGSGVNYTAGLPFVRTSPDHGTAYDIAGKGVADVTSSVNAIHLAAQVFRHRSTRGSKAQ